jgi:hypothetical protein
MEVIDIGLNDLEPISLNFNESPAVSSTQSKSVNFGPGIELLMNDKKRAASQSVNINLSDIDNLENELNELTGIKETNTSSDTKTFSGFTTNLFGLSDDSKPEPFKTESVEQNDSRLGSATAEGVGSTKTWDGFSKMNEIPSFTGSAKMSERDRRRKKRMMIKKLEDLYEKGTLKHSSHFNIDSPYEEVEDEYETAMEDKRKKDAIKLQGWWFMTFVNSVEYANAAFNPFDVDLNGWGEQVSEDLDSYEEIFGELHEKYKGGKLAPELSLLLRLGFSAAVVNFTNKALSTATPGFNDVIRQSPELMKAFTSATVNSMSQQSPGFAFANNLMQDTKPRGPPPPAPVETKTMPPPQRPGMVYTEAPGNRQDINAARGAMFREQGVEVNNNFQNVNQPERSIRPPPPSSYQQSQGPRPDMRGPQNTDIDNILSGLKTRTVDIHQPSNVTIEEDDSMISISSLKDLQPGSMPKKSRRKQRSDKNIVSLDI